MKQNSFIRIFTGLITIFITLAVAGAEPTRSFSQPKRIRYDSQCFTIDGKDIFIYSGAFHYFRCPKELWRDRFQKIKDAGFNTVETYVPWNWHEREMPKNLKDFSKMDLTDLDDWLTMAEQYGFYVIMRPGPYICAEWDTGGFPQWLLTKKPAGYTGQWLRSDEPTFLAWSKHWYDAVCPVIAKHQITQKKPGHPGVILVQLENEYDYAHFPDAVKINQLKTLAKAAQANGIDVPLFTCWTKQIRGATDPLLRQVFDTCNFYPRWNVDVDVAPRIAALRHEQADAPLMTTELQGGWFSKVGGQLSEDQDGLTGAQINNLTLLAIQDGETVFNYYMLFGGSNFRDWGARNMTTTYDYNAPIREWGGVGERFERVLAIGNMLHEHGTRLARSQKVDCDVSVPQKDVSVVMRRATNGANYIFIRTSQHTQPREGEARIREKNSDKEIVIHYSLEPFGSKVLYLPPFVTYEGGGNWLPIPTRAVQRPSEVPDGITITSVVRRADSGPSHWRKLKPGQDLAHAGIYDSQFLFYRVRIKNPASVHLKVAYPAADTILASVNEKALAAMNRTESNSVFALPPNSKNVLLLYENLGHANGGAAMENLSGISSARLVSEAGKSDSESVGGDEAQLEAFGRPEGVDHEWWNPSFFQTGWQTVKVGAESAASPEDLLTWYRMNFTLPSQKRGVWFPWRLHLNATGNGFLYLNGHELGRYWEAGPQHDFFLPECWLKFGEENVITLSLRPLEKGVAIQSASVEPYAGFAEIRDSIRRGL